MSLNVANTLYSILDPSIQKIMIKKSIIENKLRESEGNNVKSKNNIFENKKNLEKTHLESEKREIDRALYRIWLNRVLKKKENVSLKKSSINNLYKKNIEMVKNSDFLNLSIVDLYV